MTALCSFVVVQRDKGAYYRNRDRRGKTYSLLVTDRETGPPHYFSRKPVIHLPLRMASRLHFWESFIVIRDTDRRLAPFNASKDCA